MYTLPVYPRSNCWLCGRFGAGPKTYAKRSCEHCGVTWQSLLPGVNPGDPLDQTYEMRRLRGKYLPRGLTGDSPADIFDDFLDHAEVKLACPA